MSWTAIVPLKRAGTRKSRLAAALSAAERDALSEAMLARVGAALAGCPAVGRAILLAAAPAAGWEWRRDEGRGLNAELEAAAGPGDLIVVHADLPLLAAADIAALVAGGAAIAPDARGRGTNAIAVPAGTRFAAEFGEGSFARFRARWPAAAIVRREAFALDIDTPADLARAEAAGFRWRRAG